jgi:hypothetical protein
VTYEVVTQHPAGTEGLPPVHEDWRTAVKDERSSILRTRQLDIEPAAVWSSDLPAITHRAG